MRFKLIDYFNSFKKKFRDRIQQVEEFVVRACNRFTDFAKHAVKRVKNYAGAVLGRVKLFRRKVHLAVRSVYNSEIVRVVARNFGEYAGYIIVYGMLLAFLGSKVFGIPYTPENVLAAGIAYYFVEDLAHLVEMVVHGED